MVEPSTSIVSTATHESGSLPPDGAHLRRPSWLDGFRRITTSGQFIPEIDGLRFVAISLVILHHVALYISIRQQRDEGLFSLGQHGVELFFAISGFILAVPFALYHLRGNRPVRLRSYFWRRFTRIEPPYLLSLILLTAVRVFVRHEDFGIIGWNLLFSAFYVHGFIMGVPSIINGVAWSLEIEIQFYLLMPLFALVFLIHRRWIRRAVLVVFAAAVMLIQPVHFRAIVQGVNVETGVAAPGLYDLDRHLINYIQFFLAGILLADVYVVEWRGSPPPLRRGAIAWGDFAWLLAWPAAVWALARGGQAAHIALPILIFLICMATFQSVWVRRLLRVEILTVIGGMCYSIYLFHNSVIQVFAPLAMRITPQNYVAAVTVLGLCIVPLILVFCAIYFRLIEKPCMRPDWPRRLRDWFMGHLFVEERSDPQNSVGNPPQSDR